MENRITLIGHIATDIAMSATKNTGTAVAKFNVAEEYYDRGTKLRKTNFFRCMAFGPMAERIATHFFKGKKIAIRGHMTITPYEKDGVKRQSVVLTVLEFDFADSKKVQDKVDPETGEVKADEVKE